MSRTTCGCETVCFDTDVSIKCGSSRKGKVRQCDDCKVKDMSELLQIFIKHMTAASKVWFPKEMIEAKKRVEELLNG